MGVKGNPSLGTRHFKRLQSNRRIQFVAESMFNCHKVRCAYLKNQGSPDGIMATSKYFKFDIFFVSPSAGGRMSFQGRKLVFYLGLVRNVSGIKWIRDKCAAHRKQSNWVAKNVKGPHKSHIPWPDLPNLGTVNGSVNAADG